MIRVQVKSETVEVLGYKVKESSEMWRGLISSSERWPGVDGRVTTMQETQPIAAVELDGSRRFESCSLCHELVR